MIESEGQPVVTAAELEQMTPQERHEHFLASIERDLARVPSAFLATVREQAELRIAERDARDIPHAS